MKKLTFYELQEEVCTLDCNVNKTIHDDMVAREKWLVERGWTSDELSEAVMRYSQHLEDRNYTSAWRQAVKYHSYFPKMYPQFEVVANQNLVMSSGMADFDPDHFKNSLARKFPHESGLDDMIAMLDALFELEMCAVCGKRLENCECQNGPTKRQAGMALY